MRGKMVNLSKKEKYLIDDKCFLVKKGKVVTKDILKNGKAIGHELFIGKGEIIGNFFSSLDEDINKHLCLTLVEVEALEDTELEELVMLENLIKRNDDLKRILLQFSKRTVLKYYQELYDTKGYILAVLKLHAGKNKALSKTEVRFDRFANVSRSQFYRIYSDLKKEGYIIEEKDEIKLQIIKINQYLRKFLN